MEMDQRDSSYVLGRSKAEYDRLAAQARLVGLLTARAMREAGIDRGMRVLDLGCGVGDVALIAAQRVGPTGSVLGIDVDADAISQALERARERGIANASFRLGRFDDDPTEAPFDAVVGRFILVYQPDLVAAVRHAVHLTARNGIVLFHEYDLEMEAHSACCRPHVPLWHEARGWAEETFRRAGLHRDAGLLLTKTFLDAGLPAPQVRAEVLVGGGSDSPIYEALADVVRSLLPAMERFGIATRAEVRIETLADRLRDAVVDAGAQVMGATHYAAWARRED